MTRTKLILAGLIAGSMAFGTACSSSRSAQRGDTSTSAQRTETAGSTQTSQSTDNGIMTPATSAPSTGTGGAGDQSQNQQPVDLQNPADVNRGPDNLPKGAQQGMSGNADENKGNGIYNGYSVPQEDRASTGGSGYEDTLTEPDASATSGSLKGNKHKHHVKTEDQGRGGSGTSGTSATGSTTGTTDSTTGATGTDTTKSTTTDNNKSTTTKTDKDTKKSKTKTKNTEDGTGGSGYQEDDSRFQQDQNLGGNSFPDTHVPQQ